MCTALNTDTHISQELWELAAAVQAPRISSPTSWQQMATTVINSLPESIRRWIPVRGHTHRYSQLDMGKRELKNAIDGEGSAEKALEYLEVAQREGFVSGDTGLIQDAAFAISQVYSFQHTPQEELATALKSEDYARILDPELSRARLAIYWTSEAATRAFGTMQVLERQLPEDKYYSLRQAIREFDNVEKDIGGVTPYNILDQVEQQGNALRVVTEKVWKKVWGGNRSDEIFNQLERQLILINNAFIIDAVNYMRRGVLLQSAYETKQPPEFLRTKGVYRTANECFARAYRSFSCAAEILKERANHEMADAAEGSEEAKRHERLLARHQLCNDHMRKVYRLLVARESFADPDTRKFILTVKIQLQNDVDPFSDSTVNPVLDPTDNLRVQPLADFPHQEIHHHLLRDTPFTAIGVLTRYLDTHRGDPYALTQLARLCTLTHKWDYAIKIYEEVMESAEHSGFCTPEAQLELVKLYLHAGDEKRALIFLSQLIHGHTASADLLRRIGEVREQLGHTATAVECYLKAFEKDPQNARIKDALWRAGMDRADQLASEQRFEEAAALYEHAFNAHPHHPSSSLNRWIETLCEMGQHERALEIRNAVAQNMPRWEELRNEPPVALLHIARTAFDEGNIEDGIARLEKAIANCQGNEAVDIGISNWCAEQANLHRINGPLRAQLLEIGCRPILNPSKDILHARVQEQIKGAQWRAARRTLQQVPSSDWTAQTHLMRLKVLKQDGGDLTSAIRDALQDVPDNREVLEFAETHYRTIGDVEKARVIRRQIKHL